jgi:chromate transporter
VSGGQDERAAGERAGERSSALARAPAASSPVSFADALRVWVRVALLSFGGPAGQIAVMHRILVDEKRWIGERRFLHALSYCMLLPGPEAQQLATYTGWLLHGWRGGLAAGTLFVLPGFLSILALSVLYAAFQGRPVFDALLFGLKPAVMAIVVEALLRIGKRALGNGVLVGIAAAAFAAIFFFDAPFPLIVLSAAGVGLLRARFRPGSFGPTAGHGPPRSGKELGDGDEEKAERGALLDDLASDARPTLARSMRVLAIWLGIWLLPLAALAAAFGAQHVFVREGVFFSQAAIVTFGGAYAVLAYVAQQAVETYGWLEPGEMLDGLGMAETTPGPLIQVVQFVGFLGAYRNPGALDPMVAGVIGSIVVTWVTFAPCFLWIFLGAPFIESLRGNRVLSSALEAITAAVVGVISNLAVWFSVHALFGSVEEVRSRGLRLLVPDPSTFDPASAVLAVGAAVALLRFKVGMIQTLLGCVALGAAWHLLGR